MTARLIVDRFVAELGVTLRAPPDWDESEVFVGATLDVAALPTVAAVERAFAAVGFDCSVQQRRPGMQKLVGRRESEKLRCVLLAAKTSNGRPLRGDEVTVEWQSSRRPPIPNGEKTWRGRSWPLFLDDATLYSESKTLLIVEGRIPATGFAACVSRYAQWASENGLAPHRSYEPDIGGDASFADREFVVTVQDRSPYATLTVCPRER